MSKFRVDWVNDSREDYASEDEWIDAYPDNPCPNCGHPSAGEDCTERLGLTVALNIGPVNLLI
ncbi:MAG: hypothetical protein AB8G05_05600 [Oligoflexales bacterium]